MICFFAQLQASPAGLPGSFTTPGFALCACILGHFAPSGFALASLGLFALSDFVLCTRTFGHLTATSFALYANKNH